MQGQATDKKSSNTALVFIVILLIAIGAFFLFKNNKSTNQVQTPSNAAPTTAPVAMKKEDNKVKTFTVDASNFAFSVKEIKVKKGDKVKIVLINKQGFHDWVLDEFNAKTKRIKDGEQAEVEFTADKVGTFEYYCSVMKHRQMGMVGNLIVEE